MSNFNIEIIVKSDFGKTKWNGYAESAINSVMGTPFRCDFKCNPSNPSQLICERDISSVIGMSSDDAETRIEAFLKKSDGDVSGHVISVKVTALPNVREILEKKEQLK